MDALFRQTQDLFIYLGQLYETLIGFFVSLFTRKFRFPLFVQQFAHAGFSSQAVILLTGTFTGAVFAAQAYYQLKLMHMETAVGAIVGVSMSRELGPVLSALMIAGRVGASYTAELGSMKVSEQVDALRSFGIHPTDYLIKPRILALLFCMPLLTAQSIAIGTLTGYWITTGIYNVPEAWYIFHMKEYTNLSDISIGLFKSCCFGFLIALISCQQGMTTKNGTAGVGINTTKSVVHSSIAILISNFFLTLILERILPK